MTDPAFLLVERALAAGSDAAEIYAKRAETRVWHYVPATGFHEGRRSVRGLAVRLFRGGGMRFLAAPDGDPLWDSPLAPPPGVRPGQGPIFHVPDPPRRPLPPSPPAELDPEGSDRRPFLRGLEREMVRLSSGAVRLLSAELEEGAHTARLVSSRGVDAPSAGTGFHLVLRVTGEHDGRRLSAVVIEGGRRIPPPIAIATRAVDRILYPLRGRDLPEKKGELLVDPAVGTALLAGIADAFVAGHHPGGWPEGALLKDGRLGSERLTIVDDGRLGDGPNPQPVDGEGFPQRRRVVLREGMPGEVLTCATTAGRMSLSPSGNAVRGSYREPPAAGITQCYIEPNPELPPSELLGAVKSGYYLLATAGRGEFDLAADRFSMPVSGVYLQKGRARYPIRPALLAGRISELLRSVRAVGDDLAFFPREGWFGAPTLLLAGLRLS